MTSVMTLISSESIFHTEVVIFQNPLHMVFFVSQLIRYARVGSKYEDFLFRGYILVSKLLKQGYSSRTTFRKLYGRHTDLVHKFSKSEIR